MLAPVFDRHGGALSFYVGVVSCNCKFVWHVLQLTIERSARETTKLDAPEFLFDVFVSY